MAEVIDHYHGIRGFIVLAHFCEQHGPSVAYSTRLIRDDTSLYQFSFPSPGSSSTANLLTAPLHQPSLASSHLSSSHPSSSLLLSPSKKAPTPKPNAHTPSSLLASPSSSLPSPHPRVEAATPAPPTQLGAIHGGRE